MDFAWFGQRGAVLIQLWLCALKHSSLLVGARYARHEYRTDEASKVCLREALRERRR